jgi:phage terminase large subunit
MFQVTTALKKLLALNKRIKCVCGGTSASKTFSILMILIDKAQSNRNRKIDVMSESYPHLEGGTIADFKKIMIEQGYWNDNLWNESKHFYKFETDSIIQFSSIDKVGKAHGPRRDDLFINEGQNLPWEIVLQLMQRTSGDIWIDWNPSVEFWYYTEIKGKMEHDFITLTYLDNEALSDNIRQFIESRKHNKVWWQVYGLGQLGEVEGKIYKNWQEIDEIPFEAKLWRRGLDFGYSVDPTVIEDIYEYNGGYIIDEQVYEKGLSNKSIADRILNLPEPTTLVVADSAEPKSIDEIASYGINIIGATKGAGSVNQGIQFVQDQKISITKRSIKTIKAYRNYLWVKDNRSGAVVPVPDDTIHEWSNPMDAIRYGFNGTGVNKLLAKLNEQQQQNFQRNKNNFRNYSTR